MSSSDVLVPMGCPRRGEEGVPGSCRLAAPLKTTGESGEKFTKRQRTGALHDAGAPAGIAVTPPGFGARLSSGAFGSGLHCSLDRPLSPARPNPNLPHLTPWARTKLAAARGSNRTP